MITKFSLFHHVYLLRQLFVEKCSNYTALKSLNLNVIYPTSASELFIVSSQETVKNVY